MNKTLITLSGPTASGKTALSIRIAKALGAEIFSCDSRTVLQRNVDWHRCAKRNGTNGSPPSFYPTQKHSIPLLCRASLKQMQWTPLHSILQKQDFAILVGGSGLYMHAVVEGIDKFPEVPEGNPNRTW